MAPVDETHLLGDTGLVVAVVAWPNIDGGRFAGIRDRERLANGSEGRVGGSGVAVGTASDVHEGIRGSRTGAQQRPVDVDASGSRSQRPFWYTWYKGRIGIDIGQDQGADLSIGERGFLSQQQRGFPGHMRTGH